MDVIYAIAQFLVNEILSVPAYLIGIITAVGLIALRKSAGAVIGGGIKATLGFMLIGAGAGLVTSREPEPGERAFELDAFATRTTPHGHVGTAQRVIVGVEVRGRQVVDCGLAHRESFDLVQLDLGRLFGRDIVLALNLPLVLSHDTP